MQKYTEAESRTNKFVLPRRNSISAEGKYTQKPRAMQINLQWPRREPYFCRRQTSQKPRVAWRASQGRDECPVCTGGKCYGFAANRFTSHGRTGEGCRQNGRRAESAIIPRGKVLRFHGKSIHFPPKNTTLHWQMLFMKIPGAAANC